MTFYSSFVRLVCLLGPYAWLFLHVAVPLNAVPDGSQNTNAKPIVHFTDVTEKAGLTHTGWGQGGCVGDYDNDGWEDLYVTYYGKNVLYHNNGNGTFTDVNEKAHVEGTGKAWGTGCAFLDYDRDGKLDLMVANYVDYDSATALAPGERPSCMW